MKLLSFLNNYWKVLEDLCKSEGVIVKKYWKWSLIAFVILFVYGVFVLHPFDEGTLGNAVGQMYRFFAHYVFTGIIIFLLLVVLGTFFIIPAGQLLYEKMHPKTIKDEKVVRAPDDGNSSFENSNVQTIPDNSIDNNRLHQLLEKCNLGTTESLKKEAIDRIATTFENIKQKYRKGSKNDSEFNDKDIMAVATLLFNKIHPAQQIKFSKFCVGLFGCLKIEPPLPINIKKQDPTTTVSAAFSYLMPPQ